MSARPESILGLKEGPRPARRATPPPMRAAGVARQAAPKSRRQAAKISAEINVTPLVDVVLVLLIIFMVVAPSLEAGVAVELPRAGHADAQSAKVEPVTVSLGRDGKLWLERDAVDALALGRALTELRAASPDRRVVLKADRAVDYGKVRDLFKQCRDLGFPGVSLQVLDKSSGQKG